MDREFKILLANPDREWVMVLVFPLLLIINSVVQVKLLSVISKELIWLSLLGSGIFVVGGVFFTHRLLSEAAVVTVVEDGLTVQYQKTGKEIAVLFSSVAAWYITSYKGTALLRITFKDGKERALRAYLQTSRFLAMANQAKAAHFYYVHGHNSPPADAWVPSFFKQPIATACLAGLTAILAGITCLAGIPDGGDGGSFLLIMSYVGLVVYAATWLSARRNTPQD